MMLLTGMTAYERARLHTLPTLRGEKWYATDCRVVQELDVVLWKQTTLARRAFLAAVHS